MDHIHGAPNHPQTKGKIERWHQTLKNRILLENYFLPGDLEAQIEAFVERYNHARYHKSLDNLTPPTSTSDAATPSCCNEKGSSEGPSNSGACSIAEPQPKMTNQTGQSLH